MMKKQLQKQLCIFAAFAAAFLAAGSIWYWQTGDTLALTVLMFTPAVSVLLTTLLAGAGWKELLANFHLKPRLRQNKGRYLAVWLLTPVVAMGYNYGEGHPLANVAAMVLFCLVLGVIQGFLFWRTDSIWGPVLFHAAVNGIDLWKPTDLFMNSPANLFVGPNLVGIVGGLGFVLLAIWCLRQIGKGKVST